MGINTLLCDGPAKQQVVAFESSRVSCSFGSNTITRFQLEENNPGLLSAVDGALDTVDNRSPFGSAVSVGAGEVRVGTLSVLVIVSDRETAPVCASTQRSDSQALALHPELLLDQRQV